MRGVSENKIDFSALFKRGGVNENIICMRIMDIHKTCAFLQKLYVGLEIQHEKRLCIAFFLNQM